LRGADPVPEHDSSGEFIFLVAEVYRNTGERAWLQEMWPRVASAVGYLDSLRHERRTPAFETPERRKYFGLLPESISHEGYSAKPMHSYWDDFWALRGFRDAPSRRPRVRGRIGPDRSDRGGVSGRPARIDSRRDAGSRDRPHPGMRDLGDFDATSTAIALSTGRR
jgi:hypothetical protein